MIPRDSRLTRHPSCLTNGVHLTLVPQLGQAKRLPRGKSMRMSRRPACASKSLLITLHGDESPSAN